MIDTVETFLTRCREWKLTVLDLPTAYWHQLVAAARSERLNFPESLRLVVISGRESAPGTLRGLAGANGGPHSALERLWANGSDGGGNMRGTRRRSDGACSSGRCRSAALWRTRKRTFWTQGSSRCRSGVVGELCIGGVGVARGYRNRPDLTAERFIPDPFRGGKGRLYRTGDRVRFLPGGDLEYLGRVDGQIKLRGFRVEPGEIETALRGITGVREAVVRAREDVAGETRLVAYVVLDPGRARSVSDLRRLLKETLPAHMVPSNFVLLDALPRTPNGKLDVAALPAPESARPEVDNAYRGPETPVEKALTEIWMKVLRVDRVGVDDNFFELGGHSLLATQVVSRIRDVFHVELPLRDLFLNPTVAGLALAVARRQAERIEPAEMERVLAELEPPGNQRLTMGADPDRDSTMRDFTERIARLSPEARAIPGRRLQEEVSGVVEELISRRVGGGPVGLSFGQERLWLLDRLDPGKAVYNIPRAFRIRGRLDVEALGRALETIQERHEVLRSAFPAVDGNPVQVVGPARSPSLPVVDLGAFAQADRDAEALRIAEEEARRPFDLAVGPVLRATLLRLAEEEHVLLVNIHHIVFDGWSTAIFDDELSTLYAAYRGGAAVAPGCSVDSVRGFCRLAAGVVARGSARRAAFLLEGAARGCSGGPGVAHQPCALSGAEFSGRDGDGFDLPGRWPTGSGGSGSGRGRRCS